MTTKEPESLLARINRQISQMRTINSHKPDCNCGECLKDWHDDANWPTLFRELDPATKLVKVPFVAPPMWLVCSCDLPIGPKVCQMSEDIATIICSAWLTSKIRQDLKSDLASALLEELEIDSEEIPPSTVH